MGSRTVALKGQKVVTYHKSWSYVARWLGLEEVGYIEPKPGIPPTANHTAQLIQLMKQQGVKLIVVESFYSSGLASVIGRQTGARVVSLPSDVGATSDIRRYFESAGRHRDGADRHQIGDQGDDGAGRAGAPSVAPDGLGGDSDVVVPDVGVGAGVLLEAEAERLHRILLPVGEVQVGHLLAVNPDVDLGVRRIGQHLHAAPRSVVRTPPQACCRRCSTSGSTGRRDRWRAD